jgi:2-isopropylmalate synthase
VGTDSLTPSLPPRQCSCTLQLNEKLAIAAQLCRLGVDVCEAGFPVASPGDFNAVRRIAQEVGPAMYPGRESTMVIAGLARAMEKDIDRCFEAVRPAPRHRIHTFLATSDIHLEHKLRISRAECIKRVSKAVKYAAALCPDIEFSTEDGGRSDKAFLADVIAAAIEAGATTINVPDTVGYTLPSEYGDLFAYLIAHTPGAEKVVWSTHCHNDLGLAVANTLAAVSAGARQVEVTINGLGERAGNTALEEVVMALATRPGKFGVSTGIDSTQIMRTSKLVSHLTGMVVQPNKAIVGRNAFAHESGIHQDGMLKNSETYEIMTPASVGLSNSTLVLGKHSGRAAFSQRLRELGFRVEGRELEALVDRLKVVADESKVLTDADIEAIVYADSSVPNGAIWSLAAAHVFTGTGCRPTAQVTLRHISGVETSASAMGTGPVDALYNAIKALVDCPNDLLDFVVKSVTDGTDALGEVSVKIAPASTGAGRRQVGHLERMRSPGEAKPASQDSGSWQMMMAVPAAVDPSLWLEAWEPGATRRSVPTYTGVATHRDITMAAAYAMVAAVNRLLAAEEKPGQRIVGAGAIGTAV